MNDDERQSAVNKLRKKIEAMDYSPPPEKRIPSDIKAGEAVKSLLWERTTEDMFSTRIFSLDFDALRLVLIRAACPVVCRGYREPDGEDWHALCEAKADAALDALGVGDA